MFRQPYSFAVVLDVSNNVFENQRMIDYVKKQLIEFVATFDEEDLFYLYNPVEIDMLNNRGDRICAIGNYESDGYQLADINFAFKQTYYNLLGQDEDSKRVFCYITDRFKTNVPLKRLFNLNRTLQLSLPVSYLMIGLGNYDKKLFEETCQNHATLINLEHPTQLCQSLLDYFQEEENE